MGQQWWNTETQRESSEFEFMSWITGVNRLCIVHTVGKAISKKEQKTGTVKGPLAQNLKICMYVCMYVCIYLSIYHPSIHPSIHFLLLILLGVVRGKWSLSQDLWVKAGSPWTSHQFITGLRYRDRQPSSLTFTFTPTGKLEWPNNLTLSLHVFGLWEETGEPRENPCRHRENMQTPHRNTLTQNLIYIGIFFIYIHIGMYN